jgi:hypothetical protein
LRIAGGSLGPPPKPQKSEAALRRAGVATIGARGGGGGLKSPDVARRGAASELPHKPPAGSLMFDGRVAPLLMASLARAVTKTSGPFSCPVCFNSYPIRYPFYWSSRCKTLTIATIYRSADVIHHAQKRHQVDLLDAAGVAAANAAFHAPGGKNASNTSAATFRVPSTRASNETVSLSLSLLLLLLVLFY